MHVRRITCNNQDIIDYDGIGEFKRNWIGDFALLYLVHAPKISIKFDYLNLGIIIGYGLLGKTYSQGE